ncbi:MAG: hypothetical protein VX252_00385 [Myxococcota bacterium]|nr:hypothetical protein [Myxococcota bacterium]
MTESDSAVSRGVDILIFSGVCPAAVAAAWVAVCAQALYAEKAPVPWSAVALAAAGTFLVYTIDRLRDLAHDRLSSPARTAFIERNRTVLIGFCLFAAGVSAIAAYRQPPLAWLLLGIAFGLGIFHRRLKGHPTYGILYVAAAWVIVVVGLPAMHAPPGSISAWPILGLAGTLGFVIAANLVGSELREAREGAPALKRLGTARRLALGGLLMSLFVPIELLPSAAANLVALLFFRSSERYGLGVLDGALLAGALLGLALG